MVLNDIDVLHAMERDGRGIYIPVRFKQDGSPDARSSLYTMEQFGILTRHMKDLIAKMAGHLRAGDIPAAPVGDICQWCSFASVCGHEKNDPTETMDKCAPKEAFARMKRKEENQ